MKSSFRRRSTRSTRSTKTRRNRTRICSTGPTHTNVIFDAVVPFGFRLSDEEVEEKIKTIVRTLDGNYFAVVSVERSYT